jgi:acylphosphatase
LPTVPIRMVVKVRACVVFGGSVQGVFFRANTLRFAETNSVSGWVRNTMDGRVEAVFEGEEEAVRATIESCTKRQPLARVDSSEIEYSAFTGEFEGFRITH